MRRLTLLIAFLLVSQPIDAASDQELNIIVSIPPLAHFVKQITGDSAKINVMVPPGANPHLYEPTPDQLRNLSSADLYVAVGSGIEFEIAWLEKLKNMNPRLLFCDSSDGIELIRSNPGHHTHGEGGSDPHIWLSPKNAVKMTLNILTALNQLRDLDNNSYKTNAARFTNELSALDQLIHSELQDLRGRTFLVYHPAWAYFANDYGLVEMAIESEGKEPSAKHLIELIQKGRAQKIKAVFVSPQFSQKSAQMVAHELGGQIIVANDLAEDYIQNMKLVSSQLKAVFDHES